MNSLTPQKSKYISGFSLAELIISVAIISLISVTIGTFQKDIFSLNTSLSGSLNAQMDARHVVKIMVTELRQASPSSMGAYPLELASSTGITFYSDINHDGLKDKVRYFLSGTTIKKGVIVPTGTPLTYGGVEKITTIISGFVASTTQPLFQYYPSTYTGTTSPLTQPVDISTVRLVKITAIIDIDPNRSPVPLLVTSQVSIRNLKDNL